MARIEAKELRIRNLVIKTIEHSTCNQDKVIEIDWQELMWISRDKSNNYKPIPLTEEWLVRFGVEKINTTWFKIGNFAVNISLDVEWGGNWMSVRLKNVHQLQNLYFALTGDELTLKTD